MKICSKCNQKLSFNMFVRNCAISDGYNSSCKNCNKEIRQKWKEQNKERIKKTTTEYRKMNLKKYSELNVQANKRRRYTNSNFKIEHNIRGLISIAIRRNSKNSKANEFLGSTIEEYRNYLENMFVGEMNWNNRGKVWEIDHIIPIKKFDLSKDNQIKQAFHYSNTQVLTKEKHKQKTIRD